MPRTLSIAWASLMFVCSAAVARAHVYVVDIHGGAGVDFTQISAGILNASDGDVLIVHDGHYQGFTLDKTLSIVCNRNVDVVQPVSIANIALGKRAAIANLVCESTLSVVDSPGAVILQSCFVDDPVTISNCHDVRVSRSSLWSSGSSGNAELHIDASRCELVKSLVSGEGAYTLGGIAGPGLWLTQNARLHLTETAVHGGTGFIHAPNQHAPDGGPGVKLDAGCELIAAGPKALISGGNGEINSYYTSCNWDGRGGFAVEGAGGLIEWSSARIVGGWTDQSFNCNQGGPAWPYFGPGVIEWKTSPELPVLELDGVTTLGSAITFRAYGEPGWIVRLAVGAQFEVNATPNVEIEELVAGDERFGPFVIGANGFVDFPYALQSPKSVGDVFAAQATLVASGYVQRTNSAVVVIR